MSNALQTPRGPIAIRGAVAEDSAAVRGLRLEALATEPIAFSADYAANAKDPASKWVERIESYASGESGLIAVAEAEGGLVGMAGMARGHWPKTRHIGELWGVYVKPDWRGLRVGEALLEECAAWARERGVVILKLGVAIANAPAVLCYTRCGFAVNGTDPKAICVDGVYYDEYWMSREI